MRAIRQIDFGDLDVLREEDVRIPPLGLGDVLVQIVAAASCYVDLTARRGMRSRMVVPRTIGHEGAGIIEAVGEGVETRSVGDAVMIRPHLPCYACRHCLGERTGLCVDAQMLGQERDGVYAEAIVLPAIMTMPLPPGVTFAQAAVASCGVSSAESGVTAANIQFGDTVLVRGATGGIGIHSALLAQIAGAGTVIGTTTQEEKLGFLDSHGIVPLLVRPGDECAAKHELKRLARGLPDVLIDVVGAWGKVDYTRWVVHGGKVNLVGDLLGHPIHINPSRLIYREVSISVSQGTSYASLERCLRLIATDRLRPVMTEYEGFDGLMETQAAVERGGALGRAVSILDPAAQAARA